MRDEYQTAPYAYKRQYHWTQLGSFYKVFIQKKIYIVFDRIKITSTEVYRVLFCDIFLQR